MERRENWGSRLGFIFAAAGSAVGLGNIWRFPYMTGQNGGSAFIIIYIVCAFLIGVSIMIAEMALGRRAGLAAVGAYKTVSKNWTFAGVLGVVTAFLIMGFYPVVGGWALAYAVKSVTGVLSAGTSFDSAFVQFISSPVEPIIWTAVFLGMNVLIVARGINKGIEKASKILMPTLFVLLILIAIRGLTLSGMEKGLEFLFRPNFKAVTGQTILAALGQAFFSLSLGMGCMITYGSYLRKEENIPNNAIIVTSIDTGIALLAGLALFPALFAYGFQPTEGAGLVFIVIPTMFSEMGAIGAILSLIFFTALVVAALTSSISLLEVVTAYLMDEKGIQRKKAVYLSGSIMFVLGILSSLSLGVLSGVKIFGVVIFDLFDILTDKVFMAIGGLLLAVFVGWVVNRDSLKEELKGFKLFNVWYPLIKYVIPLAIAIISIVGIISIQHNILMLFGLAVIAILGVFSKKL
jgi:NSS family neurotransmitter:Na+ symporter